MNPEEYEKMYAQESAYWWFQGRKDVLLKMMERHDLLKKGGARVLDLGCGTGLILEESSRKASALGMDFSFKALDFCRRRNLKNLIRGDVTKIPLADGSMDLVLALDLMEHIEDDGAMAREINRVLRPGGHLLITVPAHQSLWSEHDEALHHFRRYSKKGFRRLLEKNGFSLKKYSFVISFTYPPIYAFRMIQKLQRRLFPSKNRPKTHLIMLPKPLNSLLIRVLRLEGFLLKYVNLPFGVSLMGIAQKK